MGKNMQIDLEKIFQLGEKVAVVTGGGGELCGVISSALAGLGIKVAILDVDINKAQAREDAILDSKGVAKAFECDVLDEAALRAKFIDISERWGKPDILINGAGGNHPAGSVDKEFLEPDDIDNVDIHGFLNLEFQGFRKVFELNFFGTFLASKVFAAGMVKKGSGTIINISSMAAMTPLTKVPAYSAAKAAVSNFTRWLAVHFSHVGIRVNALAPGFFMTEQLRFLHVNQETGELTDRARKVIEHTPMKRYGDSMDLIGAVIWLASDASRFVTGTVVPIDGGFSSLSI
jgi:NAD(P)-dependent dehydrogenase (short-subunit alcohol dehydrogenase family)